MESIIIIFKRDRQICPFYSFVVVTPSREMHAPMPHGTGMDMQPDGRRAQLAPVLPGETEGEGGLQKSSNSDTLSQTLPSQLGADSEVPSAASVRWDSGEKRPWEGSASGRAVRHSSVSSEILLSAGQRRRGNSSVWACGGSQPPPAAARSHQGLMPDSLQARISPSGVPQGLQSDRPEPRAPG